MFKRGFKAWCERIALEKRSDLGIRAIDPLPPLRLAETIGVKIWTPTDIPGLSAEFRDVLLRHDPDSWSAVTLRFPGIDLVIVNSAHSKARQASNLMHELAHILLGHSPARVDVSEEGHLLLKSHDQAQEEEANWLAGCLLLPRPCLMYVVRKGGARADNAQHFGVSLDMLTYRLRVTGVEVQARRAAT